MSNMICMLVYVRVYSKNSHTNNYHTNKFELKMFLNFF